MTAFDEVTAFQPVGDGRYSVEVHDGWGAPVGPNGGYIAALLLGPMQAHPGAGGRLPRSVTFHYLRPPQPGPAEVQVVEERSGRTMSTLSARLVQEGRPCVAALGAFAGAYEAAGEFASEAPSVRAFDEIKPIEIPGSPVSLLSRMDLRPTFGPRPFTGSDEGVVGGWTSLREAQALTPEVLALYADAWWPSVWGRLTSLTASPTVDLTVHFRNRPRPDDDGRVLARFETRTAAEGFFEEDGHVWSTDGVLLVQSRQLALLRPLEGLPPGFRPPA